MGWSRWAGAGVAAVPILALGFGQGGYFATVWGWAMLGFVWVGAVALVLRRAFALGVLDGLFVGALFALASWMLVSSAWSSSASESVLEFERALLYATCAAALTLVVEQRTIGWLIGGLLAAIAALCTYGLLTRLFPDLAGIQDPLGQHRLAEPVGYWNTLGLFAAMGVLVALGALASATSRTIRAVTGALPVVLLTTLYFTFGRAAWLALVFGLGAMFVLAHQRRAALVAATLLLAPWAGAAVALAAASSALKTAGAAAEQASAQGLRLTAALVALSLFAALAAQARPRTAAVLARAAPRRIRSAVIAAGLGALVAAVVLLVAAGGPSRLLDRAERSFSTPPAPIEGKLDQRLFRLYGEGRSAVWRVAWEGARTHPLAGTGAGSFEQRWLASRPQPQGFRNAHNLYLETVCELGALGLLLLSLAFGAPLVAAWRARLCPLVPAAGGALFAYLVHAAVDWDWEMPAVTVAALICATATLAAARGQSVAQLHAMPRVGAIAVAGVLAGLALVGLIGNGAIAASISALRFGDALTAEQEAKRAARWAPWSTEPLRWIGEARLARGDMAGARASFASGARREPLDWELWYGLALATEGEVRRRAIARAAALNPLSPAVQALTPR